MQPQEPVLHSYHPSLVSDRSSYIRAPYCRNWWLAATYLQRGVLWRTLLCGHTPISKGSWGPLSQSVWHFMSLICISNRWLGMTEDFKAYRKLKDFNTTTSIQLLAICHIFASPTIVHLSTAQKLLEMHFKVSLCHQHALSIFWSIQPGTYLP